MASGLLDQFSSLFGRDGFALVLDCASLAFDRVPMGNPAPAIVVCDSKTSRRLADGMYNRRRAEGERVVTYFQEKKGADVVRKLRDVTLAELEAEWDHLDPVGRRRARHVLRENERVRAGAEALRRGDVVTFGRLVSESHASSRDDFENSSPALNALVETAETAPGFLGGKLCGAGWAGCTVNLVRARAGRGVRRRRPRYLLPPHRHQARRARLPVGRRRPRRAAQKRGRHHRRPRRRVKSVRLARGRIRKRKRSGRPVVNLIKIGATYLNLDQATEIRDSGVEIEVFFRDNERATILRGADGELLRRWLDSVAQDLNPNE